MVVHYIPKYVENGQRYAEAWIQINIFGKRKSTVLNGAVISCADTFLHLQILHVVWIIAAHHCVPSATPACFATR